MATVDKGSFVRDSDKVTCDCGKRRFYVSFTQKAVILECVECKEQMRFQQESIWQRK